MATNKIIRRSFYPAVRNRVMHTSDKPSLTKQADLASSQIGNIMKRYGAIPPSGKQFEYSEINHLKPNDLHTALNTITSAETQFALLPSNIRERFANDPSNLIDFLSDSSNRDEAISLGLVPKPAPAEVPADPVPAAVPAPK